MPDTEEPEEHVERPATWENLVAGRAEEALGKVLGNDELAEQGEAQAEIAHEVREEYREDEHDD